MMRRETSTWALAADGLQQKWKGLKQRTAWRYKTLKDDTTAIVFSDEMQKEVRLKPRNGRLDDPLACHNVLATASTSSLNGILGATSPEMSNQFCRTMVGFMLYSCTPSGRAKVLDVLTKQRLGEITIANRALVIRAIQRCLSLPLIRDKSALHSAAKNVVCGTFGLELSALKEQIHLNEEAFIDTAGHIQFGASVDFDKGSCCQRTPAQEEPPHSGDLIQLIFGNKNITEVVTMMQHIAVESLKVKEQQPDLVKVVSDIDDTLFPGWLDKRYPLHIPYPGVAELYARLSRGLAQDAKGDSFRPSITFLTARPRGWLSVGRYLTMQHLKKLGVSNVTVLNGSVKGLVSNKKIAGLKMDNFSRFAALFPEFKFVFFGDSGQGDALLASRLLKECPEQVLGTFIHNVNPLFARAGDGGIKRVYAAEGVEFFETFAGAALGAYKKGLISAKDVRAVADASTKELDELLFVGPEAATMKSFQYIQLFNCCSHIHFEILFQWIAKKRERVCYVYG
uniref:Phosphatidate phosphatase APP1 catalytic domain-containing protein n=1 Tax=Hyaloperonospora arabidopsidis (strain Emoy2) TaxID=559515 RepID=M4BN56_HYAAE